jgi:hypothetical protein
MSRHFAAYFAIVGTLAFAPGGAANAGPFNIPHFNILRPQPHFNILRPQISMPTPHLSRMPPPHLSNSKPHGKPLITEDQALHGGAGQSMPQQQSTTGTTSGNQFSNVSGGAAPSRFRVIEDTRGRFTVVERRSENIVAAGFDSYKAASAWIANHI